MDVFLGKPLPELADGKLLDRKAGKWDDETVRDEQGRKRFHGAFTGGFSAGYFNTVGSKDGWTASAQFISSKDGKVVVRPDIGQIGDDEDFISKGDVHISHNNQYKSVDRPVTQCETLLNFCSSSTVGYRLLRKLGWKFEKQIGSHAKQNKVYGCQLPSSFEQQNMSDSDSEEELYADFVKYGLKSCDNNLANASPKCDNKGLGYVGLNIKEGLTLNKESSVTVRNHHTRRPNNTGIGIGALEEFDPAEDNDVYGNSGKEEYNFYVADDDNDDKDVGLHSKKSSQYGYSNRDVYELEGFTTQQLAAVKRNSNVVNAIPPNFVPKGPFFDDREPQQTSHGLETRKSFKDTLPLKERAKLINDPAEVDMKKAKLEFSVQLDKVKALASRFSAGQTLETEGEESALRKKTPVVEQPKRPVIDYKEAVVTKQLGQSFIPCKELCKLANVPLPPSTLALEDERKEAVAAKDCLAVFEHINSGKLPSNSRKTENESEQPEDETVCAKPPRSVFESIFGNDSSDEDVSDVSLLLRPNRPTGEQSDVPLPTPLPSQSRNREVEKPTATSIDDRKSTGIDSFLQGIFNVDPVAVVTHQAPRRPAVSDEQLMDCPELPPDYQERRQLPPATITTNEDYAEDWVEQDKADCRNTSSSDDAWHQHKSSKPKKKKLKKEKKHKHKRRDKKY